MRLTLSHNPSYDIELNFGNIPTKILALTSNHLITTGKIHESEDTSTYVFNQIQSL